MKKEKGIAELLIDYENSQNPEDLIYVTIGGKSIGFYKTGMSSDEVETTKESLINFISSDEGDALIPKDTH